MQRSLQQQLRSVFLILLIQLIPLAVISQDLDRKAAFDIKIQFLDDTLVEQLGSKTKQGMLVTKLFGGGTFEQVGILEGDIITEINQQEISQRSDLLKPSLDLREGQTVELVVERDRKLIELSGAVVGKRKEGSPDFEVIYGAVSFNDNLLRTIVTKPKGEGPFPAILFIPGYNCFSLDNISPLHPYRRIIDQFTKLGYVVYRVEKPGMGDSKGELRCDQIDFPTEIEVFKTGFSDMSKLSYVDPNGRYIFGHSLGGYVAPFISSTQSCDGVVVYGTSNGNWHEYLLQMVRFQNPQFGQDYVEVEEEMNLYWDLFYGLSRENRSPEDLVKEDPAFAELLKDALQWDGGDKLLGRHYRFNNSIDDVNTTEAWSKTSAPVLVLFGETDIQAMDPRASKEIVRIVNHYHPDQATFKQIEGTDHSMIITESMERSFELFQTVEYRKMILHGFNSKLAPMIDQWIKNQNTN